MVSRDWKFNELFSLLMKESIFTRLVWDQPKMLNIVHGTPKCGGTGAVIKAIAMSRNGSDYIFNNLKEKLSQMIINTHN